MSELPARERIILAIDTSDRVAAERLARIAKAAGARFIKLGLEISSSTSWHYCSELAAGNDLDWVADAKLDDIPNTVANTVKNITALEHPPFGITMHTTAGEEAMRAAQAAARDTVIFGVTILTSIEEAEARELYHIDPEESIESKVLELATNAAIAGLRGVVSSSREVAAIKRNPITRNLLTMTPGIRPRLTRVNDQARTNTPAAAIEAGADLLVIGRPITEAANPIKAYKAIVAEIEAA